MSKVQGQKSKILKRDTGKRIWETKHAAISLLLKSLEGFLKAKVTCEASYRT
jgi:hypothetical protein